jgi:hypothetical protein
MAMQNKNYQFKQSNKNDIYEDPLNQYNALKNYSSTKPATSPNIVSDNTKLTFLEDYSNIITNINNLYTKKYGAGNFDATRGFNEQTAKPLDTWTQYDENMALSEYEKLLSDKYNAQYGLDQYRGILQEREQASAENMLLQEQAEKYLPNQLRMAGLGKVGSSEVPIGNIDDDAIKAYNQLLKGSQEESGGLLDSYIQALKQSDTNLKNIQNKQQAEVYTQFYNNLAEYDSKEKMDEMLKIAKKSLSSEMYKSLFDFAELIAKEYGFEINE